MLLLLFIKHLTHLSAATDVAAVTSAAAADTSAVTAAAAALPGVLLVAVILLSVSLSVSGAARVLALEEQVVEGDGGSAEDGEGDQAVGQDGGVHLDQGGGEVDEEEPGLGVDVGEVGVVELGPVGRGHEEEGGQCCEGLHSGVCRGVLRNDDEDESRGQVRDLTTRERSGLEDNDNSNKSPRNGWIVT